MLYNFPFVQATKQFFSKVPKLSRIFVKLKFLRLDCHAGNLLEIRDGESFSSPLIAMFGSNNNQTGNLITTSSKIWLKLNISQPLPEAGSLQCINGFMAIFRSRKILDM